MFSADLRRHANELKNDYGVRLEYKIYIEGAARAYYSRRLIQMRTPVIGDVSYCTFLHELGHIVSPRQMRQSLWPSYVVADEIDAWDWAQRHALRWTEKMQAMRSMALSTYYKTLLMR